MDKHKFINSWSKIDFENHIESFLNRKVKVSDISIAGDGNMNFVFRLTFEEGGSVIVKQSPPYCARFPDIPAPESRIISEFKYYQLATMNEFLAKHSPKLLGLDEQNKIAYISDLGAATDFEYLYGGGQKLDENTCKKLVQYLKSLHDLKIPDEVEFDNLKMRDLNYEYIFELPFMPENNAIDLDNVTPGLRLVALAYKKDQELSAAAKELGKYYYKKTRILIHGDFYPMSWIETKMGLFIIDPEFGFLGVPEFDLGVLMAHMVMSKNFKTVYTILKENYQNCDYQLVGKFCAVEIFRRITYVSQLPIINSLAFKSELLEKSAQILKSGKIELYEDIDFSHC